MKQIYHRYEKWEDWQNGMWRKESSTYEQAEIENVMAFTGCHISYGKAMLRVINEWPLSCQHNLTDPNINQKAWIGHAACCLERGYPEYLVRSAWNKLTKEQRVLANKAAEFAIEQWKSKHHETN